MAVHRYERWTAAEDQRLLELLAAGKSMVLIAAALKRPQKSLQQRLQNSRRITRSSLVRLCETRSPEKDR